MVFSSKPNAKMRWLNGFRNTASFAKKLMPWRVPCTTDYNFNFPCLVKDCQFERFLFRNQISASWAGLSLKYLIWPVFTMPLALQPAVGRDIVKASHSHHGSSRAQTL